MNQNPDSKISPCPLAPQPALTPVSLRFVDATALYSKEERQVPLRRLQAVAQDESVLVCINGGQRRRMSFLPTKSKGYCWWIDGDHGLLASNLWICETKFGFAVVTS